MIFFALAKKFDKKKGQEKNLLFVNMLASVFTAEKQYILVGHSFNWVTENNSLLKGNKMQVKVSA